MDSTVVDPQPSHGILDSNGAKEIASRDNISPRHHHQTAERLNKQIAELSATIDAFKTERDALWEIITSRRHVQDVSFPCLILYPFPNFAMYMAASIPNTS